MKKKLAGLVVLAASVLGSYYGMGWMTERTLKKDLNVLESSTGVHLDLAQYQRGWFSSAAQIEWRVDVPEHVGKDEHGQLQVLPAQHHVIEIPLVVRHGPVIFSDSGVKLGLGYAHAVVSLPKAYDQQFSTLFSSGSTKPQLMFSVFVNMLNNTKIHSDLPKFTLVGKDGRGQFEWMGMTKDLSISPDFNELTGKMLLRGMTFLKENFQAILGDVSGDYHLKRADSGVYWGDINFSLPSFLIQEQGKKVFSLEQLNFKSVSEIRDRLFDVSFECSLGKITSQQKNYGPGVFKLIIHNLDVQALARINEQIDQLQQGSDVEKQQALFKLLPELPKLFEQGVEFQVPELSLMMPEGLFKTNALLKLPKEDAVNGNPFQLLQRVQGHGSVQIPALFLKNTLRNFMTQGIKKESLQQALLQETQRAQQPTVPDAATSLPDDAAVTQAVEAQIDKSLATWVQSGMLVLKNDTYQIDLKLVDGQLVVNGQAFSPSMLKF